MCIICGTFIECGRTSEVRILQNFAELSIGLNESNGLISLVAFGKTAKKRGPRRIKKSCWLSQHQSQRRNRSSSCVNELKPGVQNH